MQVRQLLEDDGAVSPVIGVILMVAITVILAAVIASFVLGIGGNQTVTPTAKFTFDYDSDDEGSGWGNLSVTHDGGDSIKQTELYVRGEGFNKTDPAGNPYCSPAEDPDILCVPRNWSVNGSTSGEIGDGTPAAVAGDDIDIHVDSDYEVRVVWEAEEGSSSATLGQNSGPDA